MWLHCANNWGMGMGLGLIASSLATKAVFTPFIVYSVRSECYVLANTWYQNEATLARSRGSVGKHETIHLIRSKKWKDLIF